MVHLDPWYDRLRRHNGIKVPVYYMTFAEPNGTNMELMVGESEYNTFNEQDIGELTYQGKLFKKFEKCREV